MSVTMRDVVGSARETLNDEDADRYSDPTLFDHAVEALDELYIQRPDLFIGQLSSYDGSSLTLDNDFPIDPRYRRAVADYVIARAEMKDDEHVVSQRATLMVQLFARVTP